MNEIESLRAELENLSAQVERERGERRIVEGLNRGLDVLASPGDDVLGRLLASLQSPLGFRRAWVFAEVGGMWRVAAEHGEGADTPGSAVGEAIDDALATGLPHVVKVAAAGAEGAALIAPVALPHARGAVVCAHPEPTHFIPEHLDLLKRLLPRVSSALSAARHHRERLETRARQEVTRVHTLLEALVHHDRDAILLEDAARNVMRANAPFCELMGLEADPHDLEGVACRSLFPKAIARFEDPEGFAQSAEDAVQQGTHHRIRIRMRDGRVLERVYLPIGRPAEGHLWRYRDISTQEAALVELERARDDAEQANRAKSDFLAGMSHEVRTPLHALLGMTELALDTQLDTQQRDLMRGVHTNAEALLNLISGILDVSRIEAGALELEESPYSPREVLEDVAVGLARWAEEQNLQLIVNVHPDVPERVLGDRHRVRQIVTNLVSNALRYTDRGHVVAVLDIDRGGPRPRLRVGVRDTGVGIPAAKLRTIFHKFSQAHGSERGGAGLGLTITRSLVEAMGGSVEVRSRVGVGSVFTAMFPLVPAETPAAPPSLIAGKRVGIAAGNPALAEGLRSTLEAMGCLVHAERPEELTAYLPACDVILIDDGLTRSALRDLRRFLDRTPLVHLVPPRRAAPRPSGRHPSDQAPP